MDAGRLLNLVLIQSWQIVAVAAIALVVVRLCCKRRPHLAHAIWLAALLKCFMPPVWSSPVGVFSWQAMHRSSASEANTHLESDVASSPMQHIVTPAADFSASAQGKLLQHSRVAPPGGLELQATTPQPVIAIQSKPPLDAGAVLIAVWLAGVMVSLFWLLLRSVRHRRELRACLTRPSQELQLELRELRRLLGIRRNVPLAVAAEPFGPALVGVIRPTIVVPSVLLQNKSPAEIRPLLAHELIHFRRGDHWIALAQCVARCIWWFHPAVWLVGREMRRVRELCCDEEVVAGLNCEPASYAQSLLDVLALRLQLRPPAIAPGITAREITANRLRHIVAVGARFHRRAPRHCWLALAICSLVLLPGAGLERSRGTARAEQSKAANRPAAQPARDPSWKIVVDNAEGQMLCSSMTFHGVVVDHTTGKPVGGAIVRIITSSNLPWGEDVESLLDQPARTSHEYSDCSSKTNSNGQYDTTVYPSSPRTNLTVGAAAIVTCPGYASRLFWGPYLIDVKHGARARGDMGFEFAKLELMPAEKITGRMIDQAGRPMAGLKLLVRSRKFEQIFNFDGESSVLTYPAITDKDTPTTDADGRFTAVVAKSADVEVSCRTSDPRYLEFTQSIGHRRGDIGSLTVQKGPRISARTVDAAGRPVAGVTVRPCPLAEGLMLWGYEGKTGSDGRYLSRAVPPGKYRLNLTDRDGSTGEAFHETFVDVPAGRQTSEFLVHAVSHVTIIVHMVDSAGRPLAATTYWHDDSGHGSDEIHSDAAGVLRISVPRGTENVHFLFTPADRTGREFRFRRGNTGPAIEPFTSVGDCLDLDRADHDIPDLYAIAYSGADISVSASGPDGHAITNFKPRLHCLAETNFYPSGPGSFAAIGPTGCCRGWAAPNLPFELEVSAPGFKTVKQRLQFAEGEERRINVRMFPKSH